MASASSILLPRRRPIEMPTLFIPRREPVAHRGAEWWRRFPLAHYMGNPMSKSGKPFAKSGNPVAGSSGCVCCPTPICGCSDGMPGNPTLTLSGVTYPTVVLAGDEMAGNDVQVKMSSAINGTFTLTPFSPSTSLFGATFSTGLNVGCKWGYETTSGGPMETETQYIGDGVSCATIQTFWGAPRPGGQPIYTTHYSHQNAWGYGVYLGFAGEIGPGQYLYGVEVMCYSTGTVGGSPGVFGYQAYMSWGNLCSSTNATNVTCHSLSFTDSGNIITAPGLERHSNHTAVCPFMPWLTVSGTVCPVPTETNSGAGTHNGTAELILPGYLVMSGGSASIAFP